MRRSPKHEEKMPKGQTNLSTNIKNEMHPVKLGAGAAGAYAGMQGGAAVGTAFGGPVGTVVGGFVGGAVGGAAAAGAVAYGMQGQGKKK